MVRKSDALELVGRPLGLALRHDAPPAFLRQCGSAVAKLLCDRLLTAAALAALGREAVRSQKGAAGALSDALNLL